MRRASAGDVIDVGLRRKALGGRLAQLPKGTSRSERKAIRQTLRERAAMAEPRDAKLDGCACFLDYSFDCFTNPFILETEEFSARVDTMILQQFVHFMLNESR